MKVKSVNLRVRATLIVLSVVMVGVILLTGCNGDTSHDLTPAPSIGHPAPDFTLTDLDGNIVRLSDFRGQVVFLNFWATWCPPCRAEMPAIEAVYQEYKDRDVVVIGIDLLESRSSVESFVEENSYSWIFTIDETGIVAMDYMVTGIPASFFIDKDGIIRALQVGAMSKALMEIKLAAAME